MAGKIINIVSIEFLEGHILGPNNTCEFKSC